MLRKYEEHGLLCRPSAINPEIYISNGQPLTYQEICAMQYGLSDQLLANIKEPYSPWPFALLKMPLGD